MFRVQAFGCRVQGVGLVSHETCRCFILGLGNYTWALSGFTKVDHDIIDRVSSAPTIKGFIRVLLYLSERGPGV